MTLQATMSPALASAPLHQTSFAGRIAAGMIDLPHADWDICRPGDAEGWAYLRTCEAAPPAAFRLSAARVDDDQGFAAGVPLFEVGYRLDTPLQGGWLGGLTGRIATMAPRLLELRLLAAGSPFSEECPLALHPRLYADDGDRALKQLVGTIEAEARRRGAAIIAFKDVSQRDLAYIGPLLDDAGYIAIESLPLAVLDLAAAPSMDDYLAHLSSATRKDLRRKLKKSDRVTIEWRTSINGLESEIAALYEATRTQSHVRYGDFEELPEGYFERISRDLEGRVAFACYRVDGILAAFNLLFVEPQRVIDKFLGMRYPLARDHDLYAVSWLENVRFCQRIGRRFLQTGQTAYASKLRFGSGLRPSFHMVKPLNPLLRSAVRMAAPWLAFPRWDPDLKAYAARKGKP